MKNESGKRERSFNWRWVFGVLAGLFLVLGWLQLRMDANIFTLLPGSIPEARGLKWFQESFADSGQVLLTLDARDLQEEGAKDKLDVYVQSLGAFLKSREGLVKEALWTPPWQDDPSKMTETIAYLWFNQAPEVFAELVERLSPEQATERFELARDELAYSFSPAEIGRLSYDPLGVTNLPDIGMITPTVAEDEEEEVSNPMQALMSMGSGASGFASDDGRFRIIYIQPSDSLSDYKSAARWWTDLKSAIDEWREQKPTQDSDPRLEGFDPKLGFTGGPIFSAEIGSAMERDMTFSVGGSLLFTLILFKLAHGGWRPLGWITLCMGMILAVTLGIGGWIWGSLNVVSVGFAAILLGIGVDYALTLYQEAKNHVMDEGSNLPATTPSDIRRMVGPGIAWAALTTALGFFSLSLSHFPGLSQLGGMVSVGILVAAVVMSFVFLPLSFPRNPKRFEGHSAASDLTKRDSSEYKPNQAPRPSSPNRKRASGLGWIATFVVIGCWIFLFAQGWPRFNGSQEPLQQVGSEAQSAAEGIQSALGSAEVSQWMVVVGEGLEPVARALQSVDPVLQNLVNSGKIASAFSPAAWYPNFDFQSANLSSALQLVGSRDELRGSAVEAGFTDSALGLLDAVFKTWGQAAESIRRGEPFQPESPGSRWVLDRLRSASEGRAMALGWIRQAAPESADSIGLRSGSSWTSEDIKEIRRQLNASIDSVDLADFSDSTKRPQIELAGWESLAPALLRALESDFWKIAVPISCLTLPVLWLAFRNWKEATLSLICLLGGWGVLLAFMSAMDWEWNLMNVMAAPLLIGLGVDYSIHIQKSMRRNRGDTTSVWGGVGKALCLCALTTAVGFGSLSGSDNAGMASLGRTCASGVLAIALVSIGLCPFWWRQWVGVGHEEKVDEPSALYGPRLWRVALKISRILPYNLLVTTARALAWIYAQANSKRRQILENNLKPIEPNADKRRSLAVKAFEAFAVKLVDLWRFEGGASVNEQFSRWVGWENMEAVLSEGRGALLVTLHFGNWEIGAPLLTERGVKLNIVTSREPGAGFTEMRESLRSQRGVKTWVVGDNPFSTVPLIQKLQEGEAVAALLDRPLKHASVTVPFLGSRIPVSRGAAELARASGCAILPVAILREAEGYCAHILSEVDYDRRALGLPENRDILTAEIMKRFETLLQSHPEQWFHFIPIWEESENGSD